MISSSSPTSRFFRVIILGNDAQVAARPADAVQLSRACLAFGYAFVAPASWGDELIAAHAAHFAGEEGAGATLLVHCPLVHAQAGTTGSGDLAVWKTVPPPVATARYLRAAFAPTTLHITYAGACPGAQNTELDDRLLPEVLLARLVEAGCDPSRQPAYFDDVIPADRRRFASLPGGTPSPTYLSLIARQAHLHEVAPETLRTVARHCEPNERCLLDLSSAAGCRCAVDPRVMQRIEPPRATSGVVNPDVIVDLVPPPEVTPAGAARPQAPVPDPTAPEASPAASTQEYWVRTESAPHAPGVESVAAPLNPPSEPPAHERARPVPPPPTLPPHRAALAITGSAVSLLFSPGLRPPATRAGILVPPATSPAAVMAPAPVLVAPAPPALPEIVTRPCVRHVVRRPVQFAEAQRTQDVTTRLSRRLPCRSRGSLVTARPPDATTGLHDSTSGVPRP